MPEAQRLTMPSATDQLDNLAVVLDLLRSGAARTRPELGKRTGLGRSIITQRVAELIEAGLVADGPLAPSTGGRAPRELRFRSEAGLVLVAELGVTSITAGLTDLAGHMLRHVKEAQPISDGPERVLTRVQDLFDQLVADHGATTEQVWGIGIGVPGPVEFATACPVAPPIMPGWDGYDIRGHLARRYQAPVWVDNEVNLMALGELRNGLGRKVDDLVYIKVGTRVGAGLVSGGRLHRGAQGCAGDVGYVARHDAPSCPCGQPDCPGTHAGGAALAHEAVAATQASPYLRELAAQGRTPTARDVADGASHGDATCHELLVRAGTRIGQLVAQLVNFFNPALVVIGGGVADAGDDFLAALRQAVYRHSLPLATRELQIARSPLGNFAGLNGAAAVVVDELFEPERLAHWIGHRSPHGRPELAFTEPS